MSFFGKFVCNVIINFVLSLPPLQILRHTNLYEGDGLGSWEGEQKKRSKGALEERYLGIEKRSFLGRAPCWVEGMWKSCDIEAGNAKGTAAAAATGAPVGT